MSSDLIRVLLVEDDLGDADLFCELLELVDSSNFQVTHSRRLKDALAELGVRDRTQAGGNRDSEAYTLPFPSLRDASRTGRFANGNASGEQDASLITTSGAVNSAPLAEQDALASKEPGVDIAFECQNSFDVVLLDLSLPDSHGLDTVSQICSQAPTVPIVILSGLEDESLAIEAVQTGAQDYLVKGQADSDLLVRAIRYAIERTKILQLLNQKEKQLQTANENLERRVEERTAELQQANEQLRGLEAQLRQALAQEKELSDLKSRIITTVSHEYRTPLTTISSSSEMLKAYRHKWDDDKQLKHFQRIQSAVKHMVTLVDDVLFLNKAEFEKLEFQPTPTDLIPFFDEVVDELQSTVEDKYRLTFTPQGNCPQLYLDVKLLRQILTNLLSNAIKYSPNGGEIQVKLMYEDNQVIFQVKDEGIGIPKGDQLKLFKSFSRASNVGMIAGTGLGLSIVKTCVDLHGGQITVESEVGVGTVFTVTLPISSD